MLIGCLLVVAAVAGTIATGTLLEVRAFTDALKQSPKLDLGSELAHANAGGPQTILLIGSDKRGKGAVDASSPPHSDTMILVRLDPDQRSTTMLSVPRDLKVTIHPDRGRPSTQKLNASYTLGGAKLAVKTIKQVLHVPINHVIDINFAGFKAVVNYLGCVFVQVDRRYYHSNDGLAAGQTYDQIDIQPGYQKLCGDDALHYVRYRHTDTDLVRSARQQDFLRQIKNQLGANGLVSRRFELERIFGKYASTDIRSADDVLKLLELLVQSASHPVRQVTFRADLGPSYVTATPRQIGQTVHEFLTGGAPPPRVVAPAGPPHPAKAPRGGGRPAPPPGVPLSPATSDEIGAAKAAAHRIKFPLYYPVGRVTSPFSPPDAVRTYMVQRNRAYVVVVAQGGLGQFYNLEGTTWQHPPILANPNGTIQVAGRKMQLYFEGQHVRVVAWHDGPAVYWLVNTLQDVLSNREMIAIAAAARPVK